MIKMSKEEMINDSVQAGIRLAGYMGAYALLNVLVQKPIEKIAELKSDLASKDWSLMDMRCAELEKEIQELKNTNK